ncbi:MAG: sigma-70 family RNA polymerase sigma factor [Actinomycetota bacterium]
MAVGENPQDLVAAALQGSAGRAYLFQQAAIARAERDELLDQVLDEMAGRAAAGDDTALEALLELVHRLGLHRPAITALILDAAAVDDVAQLTLVAVERHIRSFQGRSKFRTWLHSVARNEALMTLRRRSDEPVEVLPEALGRFSSVVVGRIRIEAAVDSLPEPYASTLRLQLFDSLDYEAIARRLDVPVGTVRSRLAKAKELFREVLCER